MRGGGIVNKLFPFSFIEYNLLWNCILDEKRGNGFDMKDVTIDQWYKRSIIAIEKYQQIARSCPDRIIYTVCTYLETMSWAYPPSKYDPEAWDRLNKEEKKSILFVISQRPLLFEYFYKMGLDPNDFPIRFFNGRNNDLIYEIIEQTNVHKKFTYSACIELLKKFQTLLPSKERLAQRLLMHRKNPTRKADRLEKEIAELTRRGASSCLLAQKRAALKDAQNNIESEQNVLARHWKVFSKARKVAIHGNISIQDLHTAFPAFFTYVVPELEALYTLLRIKALFISNPNQTSTYAQCIALAYRQFNRRRYED